MRLYDAEINNCIYLDRNIIKRNDILSRHIQYYCTQTYLDHFIYKRNKKDQSGPFYSTGNQSSQPEYHTPFILPQNTYGIGQDNYQKQDNNDADGGDLFHVLFI